MVASEEMRAFFEAYNTASNALEADGLARFFGDVCLAAAPGFAAATTSLQELRDVLGPLVEFYRGIERGPVHLASIEEQSLGAAHALVTVGWTTTFPRVAGPVVFTISYLVQRGDPPHIIGFVSHDDERAMLTALGIAL